MGAETENEPGEEGDEDMGEGIEEATQENENEQKAELWYLMLWSMCRLCGWCPPGITMWCNLQNCKMLVQPSRIFTRVQVSLLHQETWHTVEINLTQSQYVAD